MKYNINLDCAIAYNNRNEIELWVHNFLGSEGNNKAFSEGLKLEKREYSGPIIISTSHLKRCCGPEMDMEYKVDEKYFNKNVSNIITRLTEKKDLPPLIVNYQNSEFVINDGNHRFEAYKRCGFDNCSVLIWTTGESDMKEFKSKYTFTEL